MRAIALVPLLIALTPRGPHGPIGDMASSGNGLRTLPRHLPALDAPVFRRDEIQSPWSSRPPRGEILISPNRSTIVGITSTDVPHEFERLMIADILTKAPARVVFIDLLRLIDAYAQDGIACPA